VEWRPSAHTLGFPLLLGLKSASAEMYFSGRERKTMRESDQIERLLRKPTGWAALQFNQRKTDGYASYQKRTQNRTDTVSVSAMASIF